MSNILIVAPSAPANVTALGASVTNLLTPDPREAWHTPAGSVQLDVDLGAAATIDTVFLGYGSPGAAGAVQIAAGGVTVANGAFMPARLAWRPAHALMQFAAPVTTQALTITIAAGAGMTIGVLVIGLAFRPGWNYELGSGRTPIDGGTRDRIAGGGFAIDLGVRKSSFQCTLGDLTDEEREQLFAIVLDRGSTRPVLLVEDPAPTAGLTERIHYGAFDRIEAYERKDDSLNSWAVKIEDWL